MDIHKPKPWRGGREFLKEFGTIVLGVLVALGAEQAVEAAHRYGEVQEARAALRDEIGTNAAILAFGGEELKCLGPQVDAYAAWVGGGPKPPQFRTFLLRYVFNTWDTVKTGPVTHMPLHERLAISSFYDELRNAESIINEQRAAALVLFGADERKVLRPEEAARVLDAVGVEHRVGGFKAGEIHDLLDAAAKLGVHPPPLTQADRARLAWQCRGEGAPTQQVHP
jgi:hypothetical protein